MRDWEKVVAFHGHPCCLLAVGYRAAKVALERLAVDPVGQHYLVAVVENRTCAADAVQVITGCTFGKSSFVYRNGGKYVFTFGLVNARESLRISLKPGILDRVGKDFISLMEKVANRTAAENEEEEFYRRQNPLMEYILKEAAEELFEIKKVAGTLTRPLLMLQMVRCCRCGEEVMETCTRLRGGRFVCAECYEKVLVG